MFRNKAVIWISFTCLGAASLFGGWVAPKYSGEFLSIGMGARALGMGSAHVAFANDVTAIYWNPAGLQQMKTWQLHAMHSERFAGTVNWDVAGFGMPMKNGGALAVGYLRLGVDDIPFTKLMDPNRPLGEIYVDNTGRTVRNVPYVDSYENHSESALFVSYAKQKNEQWSYGISVKTIMKHSGPYDAWGLGFDVGAQYLLSPRLKLGAVLTDLTTTLVAWDTGRKELIKPRLILGAASQFSFRSFQIIPAFDVAIDIENRGDGSQVSMGQVGMDVHTGLEISFKKALALRAGVDRGTFVTGAGVLVKGFAFDYGFEPHEDLGSTHRISITLFKNPFAK